jgi:3-hydroxyacyl-CoA dehydrogenase / enoyl-CoA hydratase / 3-hydroxybutyryl-CoA epimerase
MSMAQAFSLEIDAEDVAWLAIDVVGEKMNTLNLHFVPEIEQVLVDVKSKSNQLKGMIIYSKKPDVFLAGADIKMIDRCQSAGEAVELSLRGQQLFDQIALLPFPVVAAIHGSCLGGGLELALACDFRIGSDESVTKLGLPEVQLGILPGLGGTQRLPRLIGVLPALDMLLTGRQLSGKQAQRLGVIDVCVPKAILLQAAKQQCLTPSIKKSSKSLFERVIKKSDLVRNWVLKHAQQKAEQKARGHYPAIPAIFKAVSEGMSSGLTDGLATEALCFGELVMTAESRALRTLFFSGQALKRDRTVFGETQITRVGVLGGGLMGAGIGFVTIQQAKLPVRIKDVTDQGVLNGYKYSAQRLEQLQNRKKITVIERKQSMDLLSGSIDFLGMRSSDVVVEAVFEDLATKQDMLAQIERVCSAEVIFATNTSSIPIAKIAASAARPENVIGLHYFSPVEKMPLVEVIPHKGTGDRATAVALELARRQGKTAIVVKDSAGFFVNRILLPYILQALNWFERGEKVDHIDRSLQEFGFPVGPLTLLDEVGFDVGTKIIPVLVDQFGERFKAPEWLDKMLADGRKGRKSGQGFYLYHGEEKRPDDHLKRRINLVDCSQFSGTKIAQGCLLLMLNEACRCLDEGIIQSAHDGDIGAVYGIGFPPFLGGPFQYMDKIGTAEIVAQMRQFTTEFGEQFAPCSGLVHRAEQSEKFYSAEQRY